MGRIDDLILAALERNIRRAWCRETSADPDCWNEENPAWGQCAVTALYVQKICGGEIVKCLVVLPDGQAVDHYYNRFPDGEETDLTWEQFPPNTRPDASTIKPVPVFFLNKLNRYRLFKQRMEEFLGFDSQ